MISGQCFYRRLFKNWQKIAQNYPLFHENRVSIPILINLVLVHPKNIHRKFEPNLCSSLRRSRSKNVYDSDDYDMRSATNKKSNVEGTNICLSHNISPCFSILKCQQSYYY